MRLKGGGEEGYRPPHKGRNDTLPPQKKIKNKKIKKITKLQEKHLLVFRCRRIRLNKTK